MAANALRFIQGQLILCSLAFMSMKWESGIPKKHHRQQQLLEG
jgi:hypothetical protein